METITLQPTSAGYSIAIAGDRISAKLNGPASTVGTNRLNVPRQVSLNWETDYNGYEYLKSIFRKNAARANPIWQMTVALDGEITPVLRKLKFIAGSIQFQGRLGMKFLWSAKAFVLGEKIDTQLPYPGGLGPYSYYNIGGWNATAVAGLEFQPYQSNGSFSNRIALVPSNSAYDLPGDFEISVEFKVDYSGITGASPGHLFFTRTRIDATDYVGGHTTSGLWWFGNNNQKISFAIIVSPTHGVISTDSFPLSVWNKVKVRRISGIITMYLNDILQGNSTDPADPSLENLSGNFAVTINGPYQTYSPLPNTWNGGVSEYRNFKIIRL